MPYRKKQNNTYRSKQKNTYRSKQKNTYRPKQYKKKFTFRNKNDTIKMTTMNEIAYRGYLTPDVLKVDNLTSKFQIDDVNPTKSFPLSNILQTYSTNRTFKDNFRYFRISRVYVKLIPELWIANNPDPASATGDGEKPRIHWMLDNGKIQNYIDPTFPTPTTSSIAINDAQDYGRAIYKSKQFTRPLTLSFAPMRFRQQDTTYSYNKWLPTNATGDNLQLAGCYNLWYGFSNIPTGWKYKTEISFDITYKNPASGI